ncbi:MAG: hypothetical protein NT056_05305 [Proteobacteria bacterium]|nr:hypothetical protein [Pseudomonadota bacterium]
MIFSSTPLRITFFGRRCAQRAALILAEEMQLSPVQVKRQIYDFLGERWRGKAPILALDQLAQEELIQFIHHREL